MHPTPDTDDRFPVQNYGPAVTKAIEWLGDRYLLARPIKDITKRAGAVAPPGSARLLVFSRQRRIPRTSEGIRTTVSAALTSFPRYAAASDGPGPRTVETSVGELVRLPAARA